MINDNTIGAMLDAGMSLSAVCYREGCRHSAPLDLNRLAAKLGREHSTLRKDLCPRLVCSACGGKDVGIWSSGGGRGPSGQPYGCHLYGPRTIG